MKKYIKIVGYDFRLIEFIAYGFTVFLPCIDLGTSYTVFVLGLGSVYNVLDLDLGSMYTLGVSYIGSGFLGLFVRGGGCGLALL